MLRPGNPRIASLQRWPFVSRFDICTRADLQQAAVERGTQSHSVCAETETSKTNTCIALENVFQRRLLNRLLARVRERSVTFGG